MLRRLLVHCLLLASLLPSGGLHAEVVEQLLQTTDYLAVDYAGAVSDGQVADTAEYAEMIEFSVRLRELTARLPGDSAAAAAARERILPMALQLSQRINAKAPASEIAALCRTIRHEALLAFPVQVMPRQAPDLAAARDLFAERCATCHGPEGRGDGVAVNLDPPPTDFTDRQRASQLSLFGLYNTITLGVSGTGMVPMTDLTEHQRWSLAFFVARFQDLEVPEAAAPPALPADRERLLTTPPAEATSVFGADGPMLLQAIRAQPKLLFEFQSPVGLARQLLMESVRHFADGDLDQAYDKALAAYLDGFEPIETQLSNVDRPLRLQVEQAMGRFRNAIKPGVPQAEVARLHNETLDLLATVEARLSSGEMGAPLAFSSAFVILFREGLEAILVVAALAAYLRATSQSALRIWLHLGWAGALVAGGATWWASAFLIEIGGAARELTEGVTALLAAAVLFWVGFWMHGQARRQGPAGMLAGAPAGSKSGPWMIAGLAFLSVYREVFETILFYQALWLQAEPAAEVALVAGLGVAAAALLLASWAVFRVGVRLPLGLFFTVCAYMLLALAVVFAGKGIAALQEADHLSAHAVALPAVEALGLFPTLEGLGVQLLLLVLAIAQVIRHRRRHGA